MKTVKALALSAALVVGVMGFSAPSQAVESEPVVVVAPVVAPDGELMFEEPTVTTEPAPVAPVVAEPTTAPVPVDEPVTAPEVVQAPEVPEQVTEPVEPAPVAPEVPEVPVTEPTQEPVVEEPAPDMVNYWQTEEDPNAPRLWWNQGSTVEAFELYRIDFPGFSDAEQQGIFTEAYLGRYMVGYVPADALIIPSAENPETVYAFKLG